MLVGRWGHDKDNCYTGVLRAREKALRMAGTVYGVKCTVYSLQFAVCKKGGGRAGAVTGLGVLEGESTAFLYTQTQMAHGVSVLLCSWVTEFMVMGCSVGGRI